MNAFPEINEICKKYNIALLYIFGSRILTGVNLINGKKEELNDPLTDIDVGVVFHDPLPEPNERYELYSSLCNELEDIFLPYPLDLVFLQENHSVFQANALCGRCIYYSSYAFKESYEEDILRRAADFRPFLEKYFDDILEEEPKYDNR